MSVIKKILNGFHPILKPLSRWYLSKPRKYSYHGVEVNVLPGVFHPGLFFSTKVLLGYLKTRNLVDKSLLELGAGSGLISIYCSRRGARVVASDISQTALRGLDENVKRNHALIKVVESNLFDNVHPEDFDIVIINPPYYPKPVNSESDMPWFCGEHFEYFEKLFFQLKEKKSKTEILMILSEDCDMVNIRSIANKNSLQLIEEFSVTKWGEVNRIYKISG